MSSPSAKPATDNPKVNRFVRFVARQPILTAEEKVFGYELLFRDGVEDFFCSKDADAASRSTLDTSMLMGLDVLCDGHRAFINCTREVLLKEYITLLPSENAVIEVLETVPPDDLVRAACQRLKAAGYLIALDDYAADDPRESLTDLADIIKVDVRRTSLEESAAMIKRYAPRSKMLAEKVETQDEFTDACKAGFTYFQGYFFRRPELLQAREIPANRFNYLRLLQLVAKEEMDTHEVENIIKSEAALCYRLLRYLNSAVFSFTAEIQSVRHALSILGEREVRRWIRLVATLGAGQNRPNELVLSALIRARFCELLAPRIKHGESDLFLVGLLSLIDAILELPMGVVLENVPVDKDTKAVLLNQPSHLSPVYHLMLAQEAGEWQRVHALAAELNLSESFIAESYWSAMQWARQMNSMA
jgi:EAL and modified HD-GYP domain-containing signal transduction protein